MAATVASAVRWWARTQGGRDAVVIGDEHLTYRELDVWTARLARRLADEGVKPGDRIGLLAPNALQWPVAALAIMKSGAVLVPLNARLKPAEIRKIADDAEISAIIAAPTHLAEADEARVGGRDFTVWGFDIVDGSRTGEPDDFAVEPDPQDPIAVIFTSGSTGLSKGVILTSQTLMGMVLENTLTEEGFRPGTVTLLVLFTIQRGKWILPQLGFGPTLRYAVSGRSGEINPFSRQQTLRGELWIYWYPVGRDGLELPKTNVRIGLAPYVDGILSGRTADDPRARFGALIEVKLGVRGYEY